MSRRLRPAPRAIWQGAINAATDAGFVHELGAIQRHAVLVARLARDLAPMVGVDPTDAATAGHLHDVGELLLLVEHRALYTSLGFAPSTHAARLRSENVVFGVDHALRGADHLLDLRVSHVIADAVADHHDPPATSNAMTIVVAAADEIADGDQFRHHALDLLGISRRGAARMLRAAGGPGRVTTVVDPVVRASLATPSQ